MGEILHLPVAAPHPNGNPDRSHEYLFECHAFYDVSIHHNNIFHGSRCGGHRHRVRGGLSEFQIRKPGPVGHKFWRTAFYDFVRYVCRRDRRAGSRACL